MAMEMVLRRMKVEDATVHGFRSSFRDWAGNVSNFPREITETALAHVIGDKAEQAYPKRPPAVSCSFTSINHSVAVDAQDALSRAARTGGAHVDATRGTAAIAHALALSISSC
jgi:hypothetical protein